MARELPRSPPSPARSLFLGGAALLVLYLFALRELSGVTNALLLGFAGAVFAVMLDLPAARLSKRMPRPLAVVLALLGFGLVLAVAARLAAPAMARQLEVLASQVPTGIERLWAALRRSPTVAQALPERIDLSRVGASAFGQVVPFLSGTVAVIGGVGIVVTIGAFLCADPEGDLRTIDTLVPARHRDRFLAITLRSAELLRRWLVGTLVAMAIVGVLTAVGLLAVGVHGWLGLGLLAFAGAAVPYLGSAVVGVVIAAAGLADSPRRALMAVAVYVVVQMLLGSVISPLVGRATIRTSPALLLIFQLIMAASFGVLGVLLAQPLLAVTTVILESTYGARRETTGVHSTPS
jgi:predicted PurR-regulated permease PerM